MISPISSNMRASSSVSAGQAGADSALKSAAQKFEAVFLRELIGSMRKAKLADDVLGSNATDSFRELGDAKTADSMAALGQFGISNLIERQFARSGAKP